MHEIFDGLTPLGGGFSGETFVAGEPGEQVVVRIYARNPDRCLVDAALLRLVRGVIAVPEVLETRPRDGDQPAVLVTSMVGGRRLDTLLPDATADQLVLVGSDLGSILARLSGMPQPRFGFFDSADLIPVSDPQLPRDLAEWAAVCRETGRLATWAERDWGDLLVLVDAAEEALAALGTAPRQVLVHSDVNAKNVMVDPDTWRVSALLDWEFAHAGSPYTDLGNALRFERHPAFADALLGALVDAAPPLGPDPLTHARSMDLWALIELANRPADSVVRQAATELLLAQARSGDVHAWPFPDHRVDLLNR